ncbi:hypothetical protein SmJEL517_g01102 [Synchytrium microbalum]|uniref:FAD/NAD(P)-binding domain-containing protein n=1 Tax=Synchytrium microbalum TaxID=1806994 RepID=A0A507C5T7_9FUNG|nr:uncharacterized protein SmJEL517_g01102 [Synchytrium microbalum]TPX36950.1 hypothetical protein SmJEL517_g01102 [Synchytrium microbalum]
MHLVYQADEATLWKFDFDPEALRKKYLLERDKRLTNAGNDQYIKLDSTGKFKHLLTDPYVEPIVRAPMTDEVDVIMLGGGFAGLIASVKLMEAGIKNFKIIEKGGGFGGTWWWNRYPGAACDTEGVKIHVLHRRVGQSLNHHIYNAALIYLPFLEETNYIPPEHYAKAPIILEHCQRIAKKWHLNERAIFQTEARELRWDESRARWTVKTNRGDLLTCKYVICSPGSLHAAKLPGIKGVEDFKGHIFHTSRWDYNYTGGNSYGNLDKLKDKRIAIIGTGATAVQAIPHLAASAKHLYVFQRTPSSIDVRNNRPVDPEWVKTLTPGWQKRRAENFNVLTSGGYTEEDLVMDGWTSVFTELVSLIKSQKKNPEAAKAYSHAEMLQLADYRKMESIRARVDSVVKDKKTAEALKVWYNQFCKRPCYHDEYLPTFNRPNVTLVDTDGKGVEALTPNGVLACGVQYDVDAVIFATGFEVGTSWTSRTGYQIYGVGGLAITDKWKDGLSTMYGISVNGFPNLFLVQNAQGNSQAGTSVNFPQIIHDQTSAIVDTLAKCFAANVRTVQPSEKAENEWVETIVKSAAVRKSFYQDCTPGYYNMASTGWKLTPEGQLDRRKARNLALGTGPVAYAKVLQTWASKKGLEGMDVTYENVVYQIDEANLWKFDFDPEALKKKYLEERDKRLRQDGNDQYVKIDHTGKFKHFLVDPYCKRVERPALNDEVDILILGGGFGGLITSVKLVEAGITSFRIIEKGGGFGGTWWWNRYPGAACDTESLIYLPLLEETNYIPPEHYAKAPIILEHCDRIAKKWGLYDHAVFQTETNELKWDEARSRWIVKTDRGDSIGAKFVICSSGPLHSPKLPGVLGLEEFKGETFHTSRWDYSITGGNSYGGLDKLKDKRVAIIGTGATGVQAIPHLGASAKHLYVFQRTPSSIDVRNNRPVDPEFVKTLKPGWQKYRQDNFNVLTAGGYVEEDLVGDGWTSVFTELVSLIKSQRKNPPPKPMKQHELLQLADYRKMEAIRARVDATVKDPKTAEALKPYYNQFCKRPCYHDEYLPTFNRPNVTLVDTNGKGVERLTAKGVVAGGVEYPVDLVIFATGFEVGTSWTSRNGYEIYGINNQSISEKWKDGMASLFGIAVNNFPNLFFIQGSQAGASVNFPQIIAEQATAITEILKKAHSTNIARIQPTLKAETEWINQIVGSAVVRKSFYETCTPGYYNAEGQVSRRVARNFSLGTGPVVYADILEKWTAQKGMEGMEIKYGSPQEAARL